MQEYLGGDAGFVSMPWVQQATHDDSFSIGGGGFSSSELNAPEYSTDDFRMFNFKVARCSKRYVHDWRSCPFAHPTENARRRDPRLTRYLPVPCPDYKRGICLRGDGCPYSHGVYECWLHPAKYRTQLCKEGPQCRRPVCFFAHTVGDLRQPTHLCSGGDIYGASSNAQQQQGSAAALLMRPPSSAGSIEVPSSLGGRSDSDAARGLIAAEEAINNMNLGNYSDSSASGGSAWAAVNKASASGGGSAAHVLDATPRTHSCALAATAPAVYEESQPSTPSLGAVEPALQPSKEAQSLGSGAPASDCLEPGGGGGTVDAAQPANGSDAPTAGVLSETQSTDSSTYQNAVQEGSSSPWSDGLAASAAMAVAMSGIPVNEQPLLPNHGPRMSNAVARKLGLAPVKSAPSAQIAQRGHSACISSPQRATSLDATPLGMPQQQQYVPTHTLNGIPENARRNGNVYGLNMAVPGSPPPMASGGRQVSVESFKPSSYSVGPDNNNNNAPNVQSALLNLVAANLNARQQAEAAQHAQQQLMSPISHGFGSCAEGSGFTEEAMASLLNSMGQWTVNNGGGGGDLTNAMSRQLQGQLVHRVAHRPSSEEMVGMGGIPQVRL